jgi:two-component system nitrogen regulation response regulator NtrX
MNALIIEDNAYEADFIETILRGDGYTVTQTGMLADALRTLKARAFDLVTLDLKLHDSGREATIERIPEIIALAQGAPVLVVTGFPSAITDEVRGIVAGVLYKPYHSQDFLNATRIAVRSTEMRQLKKKDVWEMTKA